MKSRVVVPLMLLVILTLALATGFVLVWRLFFVLAAVLGVSYLWTVFHMQGLTVRAGKVPEVCHAGDSFEEEFELNNSSRWPKVLLKVQEKTNLPGRGEATFLSIPGTASVTLRNTVQCERRGLYSLGLLDITASGLFGVFSKQRHFGSSHEIMVYPAVHALPHFDLLRSGNSLAGGAAGEFSPNASTVREYQAGDNRRHVHWQSTVRTGKLQVKVFDRERAGREVNHAWIVLDMNAASFQNDDHNAVEECCVTVAASLLQKHVGEGVATGLLADSGQSSMFNPQTGEEHLRRMMAALTLMKPTGEVFIEDLLQHHAGRFGMNSALVVVTPVVHERLTASLRRLSNRVGLIAVVVVGSPQGGASPESIARMSSLTGLPVQLVFPGDGLSEALDSRNIRSRSGVPSSAQFV